VIVVTDSSPLHYLILLGEADLLQRLFRMSEKLVRQICSTRR
jgi:hypothetical protein